MGVPVADARFSGHLAEAPVERVGRVGVAVLLAEDEAVGVPGFADFAAFPDLPGLVSLERGDGSLREDERAL